MRYHHGVYLKNARIPEDDVAYITYFLIMLRLFRIVEATENPEDGFDKTMPLDSVFNILNGNKGNGHYAMQVLDVKRNKLSNGNTCKMDDYFTRQLYIILQRI